MVDNEVIKYILQFLCNTEDESVLRKIFYGKEYCGKGPIVCILQSDFFEDKIYGTHKSEPKIPLACIGNVPVLFGKPIIERRESQIIIHADLVASTFFLISRYEELIRPRIRDEHGRFEGKESLPYRAGFIDRPIVEEYGKILRSCLREVGVDIKEPQKGFNRIFLTHDVDCPWERFTLFSACKRVLMEIVRKKKFSLYPVKNALGNPQSDPLFTFQTLIDTDKLIPEAESLYFLVSTGYHPPYDFYPYIKSKGAKILLELLKNSGAYLGYHVSYEAGHNISMISKELEVLREACDEKIIKSRNHFLASIDPIDFYALIENGIKEDFTMGYADVAGFRLGTCRAVRWIDPTRKCLTNLVLHPLTIMDCTLTNPQYMNLDAIQSQAYGKKLINEVFLNGGELTLLLHNNEKNGKDDSIDWMNYLFFLDLIKGYSC